MPAFCLAWKHPDQEMHSGSLRLARVQNQHRPGFLLEQHAPLSSHRASPRRVTTISLFVHRSNINRSNFNSRLIGFHLSSTNNKHLLLCGAVQFKYLLHESFLINNFGVSKGQPLDSIRYNFRPFINLMMNLTKIIVQMTQLWKYWLNAALRVEYKTNNSLMQHQRGSERTHPAAVPPG